MFEHLPGRSLVAFDIDDTLVSTRGMVETAYAEQGITMPSGAWGRPWNEWLPAVAGSIDAALDIHKAKTEAYVDILRTVDLPVLPPVGLARHLVADGIVEVGFLTGASREVARMILTRLGFDLDMLKGAGLGRTHKLGMLFDERRTVVYVDDDPEMIHLCKLTTIHTVHYDGQTLDELMEETAWIR